MYSLINVVCSSRLIRISWIFCSFSVAKGFLLEKPWFLLYLRWKEPLFSYAQAHDHLRITFFLSLNLKSSIKNLRVYLCWCSRWTSGRRVGTRRQSHPWASSLRAFSTFGPAAHPLPPLFISQRFPLESATGEAECPPLLTVARNGLPMANLSWLQLSCF